LHKQTPGLFVPASVLWKIMPECNNFCHDAGMVLGAAEAEMLAQFVPASVLA